MDVLIRILILIPLLAVFLFCLFGFLASFEGSSRDFVVFRIIYGLAGLLTLAAIWKFVIRTGKQRRLS